jgi:hypothetical protein
VDAYQKGNWMFAEATLEQTQRDAAALESQKPKMDRPTWEYAIMTMMMNPNLWTKEGTGRDAATIGRGLLQCGGCLFDRLLVAQKARQECESFE